ncbi:MAG: MopE-related protein [Myxococcota bacterium]
MWGPRSVLPAVLAVLAACKGVPNPAPSPVPAPTTPTETADTSAPPIDWDGDGFPAGEDCDDEKPSVYPGAPRYTFGQERCFDIDRDCDGLVDFMEDFDGDGITVCDLDCDDDNASIHPGATDPIDGIDQDCDGTDGVGELPSLMEIGSMPGWGLGHTLLTADVNGDGCDDLIVSESGLSSLSIVSSSGEDPGYLHAFLGCGGGMRSFEDPTHESRGVGMVLDTFALDTHDLLVSGTQWGYLPAGTVEIIDFTTEPPSVVQEILPFEVGDARSIAVVERESTELVVSNISQFNSAPGRGFDLPLPDTAPLTMDDHQREWWPRYTAELHVGWTLRAIDRTGDGMDELFTSTTWYTPTEAQAGIFYVMEEPGLENATETWLGDINLGTFFGYSVYGAFGMPTSTDRSLLVGSHQYFDGAGALYLLPPVAPGEHTLADAGVLLMGEYDDDWLGVSAAVGDVNADGFQDIVVGAPGNLDTIDWHVGRPGKVYVFLGPIPADGVLTRQDARVFVGGMPHEGFGWSVALADLDDDGTPEIYVGAPSHSLEDLGGVAHYGALYRIDL